MANKTKKKKKHKIKLILKIEFDEPRFGPGFIIINPPAVPSGGEMIDFKWTDFITDANHLQEIDQFEACESFVVDILTREYSKNQVKVRAVLMDRDTYASIQADKQQKYYGKQES